MATRPRTLRSPGPATRRPARPLPGRRQLLAPADAFSRALANGLRRSLRERAAVIGLGDIDGWLVALVAALTAFGLIMVYSASEALGYAEYGNASYYFEHQVLAAGLGVVLLVVAARLDYHRWRDWAPLLAAAATLLLLAVLIPHVGSERLGARRWIAVGPFSVQPSAVATMAAVVFLSRWLERRGPAVRTLREAKRYAVLLVAIIALIVFEKDLGSAMVLATVGLVLFALGGGRKLHLAACIGILLTLGWAAIRMESFRQNRLSSFLNPNADPLNASWQIRQSMLAFGSGGVFGVGLGGSMQKYQWLPEAHSDFIFAIVGEELGLLGSLAVMAGFLLLVWRGVRACLRAPDAFGALLGGGITAWLGVQAFVNMGAVTGVVPTTGITLPFISYGGTSLVCTLLAVGVLCNISAQGRRHSETKRAHVDRGRGDGRPHHAGDGGGGAAALRRPRR